MSSFAQGAAKAVSAVSDVVFTKTLSSMIKGIRATKDKSQHEYISGCLTEIKKELTSPDSDYKVEAVKKLIFLQMMGYDMNWAAFHIIEVMSLPWYGHRRIGYLAAALAFNQTTELILLTTNLLQKAFQQQSINGQQLLQNPKLAEGMQYEVGAAIGCFAGIVTPALANDLLNDILVLINNPKPYIRKRAIVALYSIFYKHPPALRLAFDKLLDKLNNDDNTSVNSTIIYVLCELISKTPKNYLDLAPNFFHILTTSSNNWVLIKIVKIMGYLVPLEPRLAKKLQEPLSSIISSTPAKSLMYECINTLLCGQITSRAVVRLCLDKLRELVESSDQNLKYLGLCGLNKLIHSFPRIVVHHKDLILNCLNDNDITIRTRALDLVSHLVTPNNLPSVIKKLLAHINVGAPNVHNQQNNDNSPQQQYHTVQYHNTVISKILELCIQEEYSMINDFEWFFYTLLEFTKMKLINYENVLKIVDIMKDLLLSIPDLRPFAINQMCIFILGSNITFYQQQQLENNTNFQQQQPYYISNCHLLQDIHQYTLLNELQYNETIGHYTTTTTTTSKLKKQALQQIHHKKQHEYKKIASQYLALNPMVEVLAVISWGIGEYNEYTHHHQLLLQTVLHHPAIPYLSATIQNSFVYCAMKIMSSVFQQRWFGTLQQAQQYELREKALFKEKLSQIRNFRQNSVLPPDFDINDDQNYQQKTRDSDDEEDDDEDDEDEDDEEEEGNKKRRVKGGHLQLTALGHNIAIGRTFAQHVMFLEQCGTVMLSGLNSLLYHTAYPQVQTRAHTFFQYLVWVFGLLGEEFALNANVIGGTSVTKDATSPTAAPTSPSKTQQQPTEQKNALLDLTSLIFKEQQQTTALDSLIAKDSEGKKSSGGDGEDEEESEKNNASQRDDVTTQFDPLSMLEHTNADTTTTTPQDAPSPQQIAAEKTYSEEFKTLISTHVQYINPLFHDELQPVTYKTQRKVPVPAGLDLEQCIYDFDADAKEKPLWDEKTHPLFPIGSTFTSSSYISSKDLDKNKKMAHNGKEVAAAVGKKDGMSFSSADFDNNGDKTDDFAPKNNNNNNYGGDNDNDDDMFMTKDQLMKKKKNRFGGKGSDDEAPSKKGSTTNASIQQRHQGDPFYIGQTDSKKKVGKKNQIEFDDLDFAGDSGAGAKNKKMAIKKATTKTVVDKDDDLFLGDAAVGGAGGDDLLDLMGAAPTTKKKKIVKKKKGAEENPEAAAPAVQQPEEPVKKVVKKKKAAANQAVDNLLDQPQQPQQQQQIPQSPSNPVNAPYQPPAGSIVVFQNEDLSAYLRVRPYITNVDATNGVQQPIILLALTVAANPDSPAAAQALAQGTENPTIPMLQLSLHANKFVSLLQSPVPQQPHVANHLQVVIPQANPNVLHVQMRNITQQQSVTGYFAIQWKSNNISTTSRYFNFDLKFMNQIQQITQYVDPATETNTLTLPTSAFIQPNKITMQDVGQILTAPDTTCTAVSTYIAKCNTQQEIMVILKGMETSLNVALLEAVNKTAVYYGRCVTLQPEQSHVCVYVKCMDDLRVHITIKTCAQVLSDKLQQDVITLLDLDDGEGNE